MKLQTQAAIVLAFLLTSVSLRANSQQSAHENYLTIATVEMREIPEDHSEYQSENHTTNQLVKIQNAQATPIDQINAEIDKADVAIDKVINIGQKIWNVVKKGKPVVQYVNQRATALPENINTWQQLENWQKPKSKTIEISYKNLYGVEVIKFVYKVILLYGGSFDGRGQYVGYAAVEPVQISTAYMFNFDANAQVESTFNMGSKDNPVAGMILNISWEASSVVKSIRQTHSYHLDGQGSITAL